MSMELGEGARDGDGEFKDMVDAKDSSRSEERKSSISFVGRLNWIFCGGVGGDDGAGLRNAMSSGKLDNRAVVKGRCRGVESESGEKVNNMFITNATRSRDGKLDLIL
jgi:hypothetical protein